MSPPEIDRAACAAGATAAWRSAETAPPRPSSRLGKKVWMTRDAPAAKRKTMLLKKA